MFLRFVVLLFLLFTPLSSHGRINFGSKQSSIVVASDATFNVGGSSFTAIKGTIEKKSGATLSAGGSNTLTFSSGMLVLNDVESRLTGAYVPSSATFQLRGNEFLNVEPGVLVSIVNVFGPNNRVEGQPVFKGATNSIVLANGGAFVDIGIQNNLARHIVLNGGTAQLCDDLNLGDDTKITGTGTVKLNGKRLNLGGLYTSNWDSSILWDNATDIVLNGSTSLATTWTFSGVSVINGNGNVLNMINGGKLRIEAGSTLFLTDITLKNMGDSGGVGQIEFLDNSSTLVLSQADIDLFSPITLTQGKVVVDGISTFVLKDKNWSFNGSSLLQINGITLWLDVPPTGTMGNLVFAGPSNVSLVSGGTFKFVADKSIAELAVSGAVTGTPLSGSSVLDQHVFVGPSTNIQISSDSTIDGRGSTIQFAEASTPQIVLSDNTTLALKDVSLRRLNNNTFGFGGGSRVELLQGVAFEFIADTNFSSSGLFDMTTTCSVFRMNGLAGQRKVTLSSAAAGPVIQLGPNTMELYNMQLEGLEFVGTATGTDGAATCTSEINMRGNSLLVANGDTAENLNITAAGNDNEVRLRNGSGQIIMSKGLLSDFSVHTSRSLSLTVSAGAAVVFADLATALKTSDTLYISGNNNTIGVSNRLTISSSLVFQPGSEVTFVFDDQADDASVIIDTDIVLPAGCKLTFRGNGTVVMNRDHTITMSGSTDDDRSEISCVDSASLTLQESVDGVTAAKATIQGFGSLFFDDGGQLKVDALRHLTIGGRGVGADNISIFVDRAGAIKAFGEGARISIHQMTGFVDCEQGGRLAAGAGGVIEINAFNDAPSAGVISRINFDADGILNIATGGRLVLSENSGSVTFNWDNTGGVVDGDGVISLAEQGGFAGKALGSDKIFELAATVPGAGAEEVVRRLINIRGDVLPSSAVFTDELGTNFLKVKNTDTLATPPIIALFVGDTVTSEDLTGVNGLNDVNVGFRVDLAGARTGG